MGSLPEPDPHTIKLPPLSKTAVDWTGKGCSTPRDVAQTWLANLEAALAAGSIDKLSHHIHEDGWWRDHLALSWEFHTLSGRANIAAFLKPLLPGVRLRNLKVQQEGAFAPKVKAAAEGLEWVESMFTFDTAVGSGKGMLRLVCGADGEWKAHMIYTALQELHDHQESIGERRAHGGNNSLEGGVKGGNWFERRQRQQEFLDADPAVVVIGAGQAGLNLAARLQNLDVPTLLVDKNERVGDNWRHRYRTLVTHDPVHNTHLAYMPFPPNWPLFTPKDKLADWFELYASAMELNVWLRTTVASADYHDETRTWTVALTRPDGSQRTLRPNHVVMCTGHSGEPRVPTFPNQQDFAGTIYHASRHRDASTLEQKKKVLVIGTGNSGHDIAQNYHENGHPTTLLQRSGTYVLTAEKGIYMLDEGLYEERGPATEDADIVAQSLPLPVQFALSVGTTKRIAEAERETVEGLGKAGFKVDFGDAGDGLYRKYVQRGGGYYIDVGASKHIISGGIRVVRAEGGVERCETDGVVLVGGEKVEADVVVLATGYDNMRTTVRKVLGEAVAGRCRDVWGLDREGEVNAMWRPCGHPRLWFMGGNLTLCRTYSKFLALQIKAVEAGLNNSEEEAVLGAVNGDV